MGDGDSVDKLDLDVSHTLTSVRTADGPLVFCWKCGRVAQFFVRGLNQPCPGRPRAGGAEMQRKFLVAGIHPVSKRAFIGSHFFPWPAVPQWARRAKAAANA